MVSPAKNKPSQRFDCMVRGLIYLVDTPPRVMVAPLIESVAVIEMGNCLNILISCLRWVFFKPLAEIGSAGFIRWQMSVARDFGRKLDSIEESSFLGCF